MSQVRVRVGVRAPILPNALIYSGSVSERLARRLADAVDALRVALLAVASEDSRRGQVAANLAARLVYERV